MKYESLDQLKKLIVNGVLKTPKNDRDIIAEFDILLPGLDIKCGNIDCLSIKCGNIDCLNIDCLNIDCWDIDCGNIKCGDIKCGDIKCGNIDCLNIDCYAFCIAHETFKCVSAKTRRSNGLVKCLDSEIVYK